MVLTNETPKNRLASIVSEARALEIQRQRLKTEYEASLAKLNESYKKRIDRIVGETNTVMDDAAVMVSDFRDELFTDAKTIKFADGEVSIRLGTKAVVIPEGVSDDEVLDELRKRGVLKRTTVQPPRKLSKKKIQDDPAAIEGCKNLSITQTERVKIKLPDNAGNLEHDLPAQPLRRDLK